jgi:hypothetical protein
MSLTYLSPYTQELFPVSWVQSDTVQTVVRVSPLGVCLLQAVRLPAHDAPDKRNMAEFVTDFCYLSVNDVLLAMFSLPLEDILLHNMKFLNGDSRINHLINQLAQTVVTGQPGQSVETYQLDGVASTYHQLYVKSDEGILMLVQDITYNPLSSKEKAANEQFLRAIDQRAPVTQVRKLLLDIISGHTS